MKKTISITIWETQWDSIGDTSGMTDEQITAECDRLDKIIMKHLRKGYPEAEIEMRRGQSMHEFEVYPLDETDQAWKDKENAEASLSHILGQAFDEWCG